jgi:hypothetical protein
MDWSRCVFLLGAVPFLFLGTAHAIATPLTPEQAKGLSPRDPEYRRRMAEQTLLLTRRLNLWEAWVGFNFRHSLGAVLLGVVVLLAGRSEAAFAANAAVFVPLGGRDRGALSADRTALLVPHTHHRHPHLDGVFRRVVGIADRGGEVDRRT